MFKRIIYFLVFVFSLTLTSCKKVNDHKVKFEIEFIEDCQDGYSDMIDVICKPSYNDEQSDIPSINKENIKPGFVWKYEYWELRDGDKVLFTVMPQQGYHFIMKVYLDDKLVSYREVITGYGAYYVTTTIDIWGINNEASSDSGIIEFVYSE